MAQNKSILVISDSHAPFSHRDIIAFLKAIKAKYSPDRIVHIGDEIDGHSISFHDHDPDLMSPADELTAAISKLKQIYKLFPEADVLESNHGSLVYRRQKHHGLPRSVFKGYRDILEAPKGWRWHPELIIRASNGMDIYFHHGKSGSGLKLSQAMGMACVQGHFHETLCIQYWGNPIGLYWSMQVGCLIDKEALAFEYCKNNMKRPLIGCGIILNGYPLLLPMILNKRGRWIGKLL